MFDVVSGGTEGGIGQDGERATWCGGESTDIIVLMRLHIVLMTLQHSTDDVACAPCLFRGSGCRVKCTGFKV
jgi:hypothetical protein